MKLLLHIFLFFLYLSAYSQEENGKVQILLKGKVTDEYTGKPVGLTMEFREPNGKKFKINSNSIDGSYQQVVTSGAKFDILFSNFDIVRKFESIKVADSGKYIEQILNFKVQQLNPGLKLYSYDAFVAAGNSFKDGIKKQLENLKEIMQFNRGVKFELSVNSHDTYKRTEIKTEVKPTKKKSKKKVTETPIISYSEPDQNQIKSLVDERVKEVKDMISEWGWLKERVTLVPDYSSGSVTDNNPSTLFVIVKELKNAFE